MYCRTDTRWSYWSRGEANFFIRLSWMKIERWTMLGYGWALRLLSRDRYQTSPQVWCA